MTALAIYSKVPVVYLSVWLNWGIRLGVWDSGLTICVDNVDIILIMYSMCILTIRLKPPDPFSNTNILGTPESYLHQWQVIHQGAKLGILSPGLCLDIWLTLTEHSRFCRSSHFLDYHVCVFVQGKFSSAGVSGKVTEFTGSCGGCSGFSCWVTINFVSKPLIIASRPTWTFLQRP